MINTTRFSHESDSEYTARLVNALSSEQDQIKQELSTKASKPARRWRAHRNGSFDTSTYDDDAVATVVGFSLFTFFLIMVTAIAGGRPERHVFLVDGKPVLVERV